MKPGQTTAKFSNAKALFNPTPYTEVPPIPPDLDMEARLEWDRVCPVLVEHRILTEVDIRQLAHYCKYVSLLRQFEEQLKITPLFVTGTNGSPKSNPYLAQYDTLTKTVFNLADHFGLTPKSRGKVGLKTPSAADKKDDFSDFINDTTQTSDEIRRIGD